MKHFWLSVLAAAGFAGCSSGTPVTVTNGSSAPIEAVVLSGSGFTEAVGTIAPGESVSLNVHPRGESGLAVSFRTGNRRVTAPSQGYFEGGGAYRVRAVVGSDLAVEVDSELKY